MFLFYFPDNDITGCNVIRSCDNGVAILQFFLLCVKHSIQEVVS